MTRIIGRPDVPTSTPITATLTYTQPYQRGDRLGIGSHQLDYDWANSRWNLKGTATEFDLVAARFGQSDPAPRGGIRLTFKVGAGAGQQGGVMGDRGELIPVETAAGVLDITKPIINVAWVTGPALSALIADATAAAQLAEDAAQQVTDAILDLSAERQAVADSLVATAQSIQQAQTEVDRLRLVNNVGAADIALLMRQWTQAEAYEPTAITRNADGLAMSATVKWPDGSMGTLTATNYNATHGVYDGYTITHSSGKTVTQAAVTRNSDGAVTVKPALVVA